MNGEQLKELADAVAAVKYMIVNANKLHGRNRYATVSAAGDAAITHMQNMRDIRSDTAVNSMLNADMLDSFAFFSRFGDAGDAMLQGMREGFDRKVEHIRDAQEYAEEAIGKTNVRELSGKKAARHTFTLAGGTVELTTAQIMELYELNKREQARGHITPSHCRHSIDLY